MRRAAAIIALFASLCGKSFAQIECVETAHPVYKFLLRAETKGALEHFSLSSLPLQRREIVSALKAIRKVESELSAAEISTLEKFEREFEISPRRNSVVFYSESDSIQVFFDRLLSEDEKFIYRYKDSATRVSIKPLATVERIDEFGDESNRDAALGDVGFRLFGTIKNNFGFYLSATNGRLIGGDRELTFEAVDKLRQNVKFRDLGSDIDFSESHLRVDFDWFYAMIGRQTRLVGAGLNDRLFVSGRAAPYDALSLGAKFETFEYRFEHGSLIGMSENIVNAGFNAKIPDKFIATHRFAIRPSWGEISFWEAIIYSDRNIDLAYLNPLSFYKSLEHALRDRDNSIMGMDLTLRPFSNFQIKGSFLLDDIIIEKIGDNYWSNKTAWNLAAFFSTVYNLDFGVEYCRIEPYTYSHFNPQNAYINDGIMIGSSLLPNSDRMSAKILWLFGERYPLEIDFAYFRHGANVYDENGVLIKNVGADPHYSRKAVDDGQPPPPSPETVTFLDGDLQKGIDVEISTGWEIYRGFNVQASVRYNNVFKDVLYSRLSFRFGDY